MTVRKHLLPLLLALTVVLALFSGCSERGESGDSSTGFAGSSKSSSSSGTASVVAPDFLEDVAAAKEINPDTVGWLWVGGTHIEDVVVCSTKDNKYYMRRTFEGLTLEQDYEAAFEGVYYADYRSRFGDGSRAQLGTNTCIYGHAMTDNEENERYNVRFGPLHDFREPEYAKEMPYIFFTTEKENLVFEVIAVFTVNSDNAAIPYNKSVPNDASKEDKAAFVKMVEEEILPRSKYDYGVKLKDTDKFITLSTCIYTMDNGYYTNYPNTYMRYGVMARLVEDNTKLKEQATFKLNENVIYDKDGKISSK